MCFKSGSPGIFLLHWNGKLPGLMNTRPLLSLPEIAIHLPFGLHQLRTSPPGHGPPEIHANRSPLDRIIRSPDRRLTIGPSYGNYSFGDHPKILDIDGALFSKKDFIERSNLKLLNGSLMTRAYLRKFSSILSV